MAKPVLVLTKNKRDIFHAVMRTLKTLGIPAVHGILVGTGSIHLQTPLGTIDPDGATARNFLRNNFSAIFLFERVDVSSGASEYDAALNTWLSWNAPDDPPVVFFSPNLSTARTSLSLPSDFPIIRPDPANLDVTAVLMDSGVFTTGNVPGGGTAYPKLGAGVRLTRENLRVYTPTVCLYTNTNDVYFWKLDETKHNALGSNGEILAVPEFPDKSFPVSPPTIIAYRYFNRYFLPMFGEYVADRLYTPNLVRSGNMTFFWLLYALKLCGIPPARKAVLAFEIDHPIITRTGRADGLTEAQQLDILKATYEWMANFSRETGLVFFCGVETGGRSGRSSGWHYNYLTHTDPVIRAKANAVQQVLLANLRELPCGVHDHSAQPRDEQTSYTRIGNNEHPYAAPNDVPVQPGICVSKKVMPTPPPTARDYGEFWDLGPTQTSGTGTTITKPARWNLYTARINLYDQVNEMVQMGWPDGKGGSYNYTNTAGNEPGDLPWWEVWRELGFRGVRAGQHPYGSTLQRQTLPPSGRYKGLWFVPTLGVEWNTDASEVGSYGLYRAGVPADTHAVGTWDVDVGNEIATNYAASASARWKAYRRVIGCLVGRWLRAALYSRGVVFLHPPSWFGADPSNPTGVVDTGSDLKVNPMVELCEAMRAIVQVLSDYLRFGGPSDVMDLLDEVGLWG